MSQAPAQLTIKRPPEPVSQMPEQLAVGRQAHEGVAPHPAGNAKQEKSCDPIGYFPAETFDFELNRAFGRVALGLKRQNT
jgi:hypothetical protein